MLMGSERSRTALQGRMRAVAALVLLGVLALAGCSSSGVTAKPGTTAPAPATATPVPIPPSVYVGANDGNIYALAGSDGSVRWKYSVGGKAHVLALDSNIVFAGSRGHDLVALSARDGSLLWQYDVGSGNQPVTTNGIVYVNNNQSLYALNETIGVLLWKQQGGVDMTVADGVVYVTVRTEVPCDGPAACPTTESLYAYNASNGSQLWKYDAGYEGISTPVIVDGVAYATSLDGAYALKATTGTILWHVHTGFNIRQIPAASNGTLYFGSQVATYAIKLRDGSQLWQAASPGRQGDGTDVSSIDQNGTVFVAELNSIYALDGTDGSRHWITSVDGVPLRPVLNGTMLYVPTRQVYPTTDVTLLYALDSSTGSVRWRFVSHPGSMSVVPAGSTIYALSSQDDQAQSGQVSPYSGIVYALKATDGSVQWKWQAPTQVEGSIVVGA